MQDCGLVHCYLPISPQYWAKSKAKRPQGVPSSTAGWQLASLVGNGSVSKQHGLAALLPEPVHDREQQNVRLTAKSVVAV